MNSSTRLALLALTVILASPAAAGDLAKPEFDRIRDAVRRGLKVVQKSARSYPDPHGKSQFISIPATSWATTALALAAPREARF